MSGFITKIEIEKIRHLKDFQIEVCDDQIKHLIITGKNGSGKTSLLERIKDYLQVIPHNYLMDLIYTWPKNLKLNHTWYDQILNNPTRTIEQNHESDKFKKTMIVFENNIKKYANGLQLVFNKPEEIADKYIKGEYILAYFSATRNVRMDIPTNVPKIQLQEKYDLQQNIGAMFLNYLVYLKTQQSFARNENDMVEVNKIQHWFDNFEEALRILFEDNSIYIKFDYKNLNFTIYQDDREPYGFDVLSDGYSAVLDIIINIILRMEKHRKEAYDTDGIVIIDELENHLHIGLQKNMLPFLTRFFPNIQFIVSTHSPFVINSIENAVIFDLEKKQRIENLSGIGYQGIVEGYFDLNQYSEKIINKLERYNELTKKEYKSNEEIEEELILRRYLKGVSPELSPEVVLAYNNIEIKRKQIDKNVN